MTSHTCDVCYRMVEPQTAIAYEKPGEPIKRFGLLCGEHGERLQVFVQGMKRAQAERAWPMSSSPYR